MVADVGGRPVEPHVRLVRLFAVVDDVPEELVSRVLGTGNPDQVTEQPAGATRPGFAPPLDRQARQDDESPPRSERVSPRGGALLESGQGGTRDLAERASLLFDPIQGRIELFDLLRTEGLAPRRRILP